MEQGACSLLCSLNPGNPPTGEHYKGTVQQDVTGVKIRLKQSAMTNYLPASLYLLISKEHLHERGKKLVSGS
jgi:hypothetical protein